jgi:hypothetical protein
MSNGVWNIFYIAWEWVKDDSTVAVNAIVKSLPTLSDPDALFCECNRDEFANLLLPLRKGVSGQGQGDEGELEDRETTEAYERTVSYMGSVHMDIKAREHSMGICRRLMAFAALVPKKMIELVEEKKPRALVVLARYFALAGVTEGIWWIGKMARREVEGIQKCLLDEWQDLMNWPLAMTAGVEKSGGEI